MTSKHAGAKLMWAVKDPSGNFIGPVHPVRKCAFAMVGIHGQHHLHRSRGYRCVRVIVSEVRKKRKASK